MSLRLTEIQQKIYKYLVERLQNGVPPSVREIGSAVGLKSTSSVQANLDALEAAGYISRDPMLKRSIRIPGIFDNVNHVPLVGTVTAGVPITAVEQIESYMPVSNDISQGRDMFALRIRGDSMYEAGIFDGDIVFVEQVPTADNGDIVIALIEDEATCKRFFREKGHFRLQPENDNYEPIILKELTILGRVVASMRYY